MCDLGSKYCDKVSDLEYFFRLNEALFDKLQSYFLEEKRYQVHIVAIVAILNRCIFFIYYLESHVQSLSIKNQGFHDKIKKIWRWKFDVFCEFLEEGREKRPNEVHAANCNVCYCAWLADRIISDIRCTNQNSR